MKNSKKTKGRYNFIIDTSVYREFSRICDSAGLIRSKVIENHMSAFASGQSQVKMIRAKTLKKGRFNFLIDEKVYRQFSAACDEIGLIRSKNIENFIRDFNKENSKR